MTLFGAKRLAQVEPRLVRLVYEVARAEDILVIEGARSVASEAWYIAEHHSALRDPYDSKHVIGDRRPLAAAVDLGRFPLNWTDLAAFVSLATVVLAQASALSLPLVWGGSWPHFQDLDHYELAEAPRATHV